MVFCVISGCSSKSGRDKDKRLFRVPKVRTNQGTEHEELTLKRRTEWISAISRGDSDYKNVLESERAVTNISSSEKHLLSGTNFMLTGCQLSILGRKNM